MRKLLFISLILLFAIGCPKPVKPLPVVVPQVQIFYVPVGDCDNETTIKLVEGLLGLDPTQLQALDQTPKADRLKVMAQMAANSVKYTRALQDLLETLKNNQINCREVIDSLMKKGNL
jgi:hypothetical protein